jgi:hypothetical protein
VTFRTNKPRVKHRTNIYVIIRRSFGYLDEKLIVQALDSFRTLERAEEMMGVYEQKDLETNHTNRHYTVDISTFYDE